VFAPHAGRVGTGDAYRATANGPGASPLVRVGFAPPPPFNRQTDAAANADQRRLLGHDPRCVVN
jgi:hypothetical protein